MSRSTLRRTKMKDWFEYYREACPVCHKNGGCMINGEGDTVVCVRTESKILFSKKMPMWVHHLGEKKRYAPKNEDHMPFIEGNKKADDEQLNETFTAMLRCLQLSDSHKEELTSKKRQMSLHEIKTRQYVSFPKESWKTARSMIFLEELHPSKLVGTPGFHEDSNRWAIAGVGGILVPYRNTRNQIVGFQTRSDDVPNVVKVTPPVGKGSGFELKARVIQQPNRVQVLCDGEIIADIDMTLGEEETVYLTGSGEYAIFPVGHGKRSRQGHSPAIILGNKANLGTIKLAKGNRYFWLSSANRKNGTGAGDPLPYHISVPTKELKSWKPGTLRRTKAVWVTEGAIKADIAVEHISKVYSPEQLEEIGSTFLAAPGVNAWRTIVPAIEEMGVERVNIAIDMDMMSNHYVYNAVVELAKELHLKGYKIYIAQWNENDGNGIDDLLINRRLPHLQPLFK